MACWSAENATKAYLRALKMGKRGKEPDVAEFISALAAGNNAQLMVMASSGAIDNTPMALGLIAAAHQTKGRVMMILSSFQELQVYENSLGPHSRFVEFLVGDSAALLLDELKSADFVLIDCKSDHQEQVFKAASGNSNGALIVGYNAQHEGGKWSRSELTDTQFLPIGEGLLVSRAVMNKGCRKIGGLTKKSCWVVKVDELTGEEHVFRIVSPRTRDHTIRA
ncbi:uncharacterized protein LOC116205184 [Punica granatum]|uniref:Uncharacterized protein n=2 Tax=Punica granatum TaxID=22663 RepID=A0A218VWS6_PUNGR|nr:uncharacterized protein LOC116205184 [Punica granatum]OWM64935.1 hypothetical protein CDL15_Pgr028653 [Punica granatum]PKI70428.1 hypothetical protein CRG98_009203 [Punica granatum]